MAIGDVGALNGEPLMPPLMTHCHAISICGLSHSYGQHLALRDLDLAIEQGEAFAVLGPNGGGKSTLFRVLSTLIRPQRGSVSIFGHDVGREQSAVRALLGIVFQSPSVDKKLTVFENLRQQAALYGLPKTLFRERATELLGQLGLTDRTRDLVERLSGGLRRRVELAKGMIHRPRLLLMDEPSTGLDPGARVDLWEYLHRLRNTFGVTVVLTTHLLEEAEKADRIAILNEGRLVALDQPAALRARVGGDALMIETRAPEQVAQILLERLQLNSQLVDGRVRLEEPRGHVWVPQIMEACGQLVDAIRVGRPTLEDVFIDLTGHQFWQQD
jgi:ABC-2 type transport system ATP-binding protein